ncbi:MAG: hypothetical protein DMG66_05665, partial [Acidobacteria bacterium]
MLMLGLAVSAQAKTVHVQVGPNNALIFSPASVTINVGDTVEWDWAGNNHTVTSGGCCSFNGLFDLGTKGTSPPTGQNAGFAASHTFTQPGSFPYFCRVHGSNFGMTGSVTALPPDYSISIPASTVTAFPTQTATFTGLLTTQSGYNSQVSLSCVQPSTTTQIPCTPNPANVIPSPGGTAFSVSLDSGLSAGNSQFQVHAVGSDGTKHDSQVLTLKVVSFDFSGLSSNITIGPSATSAADALTVTGSNGFSGAVTLSCGNLPANTTCSFSPSNVAQITPTTPSVNVSLRITTAQTPGGVYQGASAVSVIAGTPGAPDLTKNFTLTVPDYTLAVANPLITVFPGSGGTFNAMLTSSGGFSGSIAITCGTSDATVQCAPSAGPIGLGGANGTPRNFSVTFTTTAGTQAKDYTANIQASDGNGLNHTIAATIRVVDIDIRVSPSVPSPINVAQGNPTAPAAMIVSALGNWSPTITLSCSGPAITAGASCVFSPGPTLTPGPNGAMQVSLVILTKNAPTGQSTVMLTASAPLINPQVARVNIVDALYFVDVKTGQFGNTSVYVGDTVEWDWAGVPGIYAIPHTTTSGKCVGTNCTANGNWDSGKNSPPHIFPHTFSAAGDFPYYCGVHVPLGYPQMEGAVHVLVA